MTLRLITQTLSIAFGIGLGSVYLTAIFLRRLPGWPRDARWFLRFVIPLASLIFLSIIRSRPLARADLDEYSMGPWTQVMIVLSAFAFLLSCVRLGKRYLWNVFDISHEDNLANRMRQTQLQFVEKLSVLVLVVLAIGSMLLSFEAARQFGTSLLATAGVATFVIGIAGQKIVANLLAGMQIAFAQPIRLDDAVVIEGEWGWIEEITLTYVVVRIWDLRRLIVPLSRLLEQPFQNWTRTSSKIIGSVFIHCSYLVDVDQVRDELDRILARTTLWDGDTKVIQVVESHVHTMELRVLISAKSSPRAWDLRCFVREQMLRYLAEIDKANVGQLRVGLNPAPAT